MLELGNDNVTKVKAILGTIENEIFIPEVRYIFEYLKNSTM